MSEEWDGLVEGEVKEADLDPVRMALEAMREAYGNGRLHQMAETALATLDAARKGQGLDVEWLRSEVSALVSPITASRALGKEPYPKGYVSAINDVLAILDPPAAGEGR